MKEFYRVLAIWTVLFSWHDGCCQYSIGTAVVAVNTGTFAVIAADSLGLYNGTANNNECKIRFANPKYIAVVAGIGADDESRFHHRGNPDAC